MNVGYEKLILLYNDLTMPRADVISTYVYRKPIRYLNGNISECRRNIIRYPKKCRSLRTWKKFYEMFPKQAEIDGWDGKTSNKMK